MSSPDDLIFLASPYTHSDPLVRYQRYVDAKKFTVQRMSDHEDNIFSPIVYTHPLHLLGVGTTGHEFWKNFNRTMLVASTEMWILTLDGWEQSMGIRYELTICLQHQIPTSKIGAATHALSKYIHYG